MIALDSSALVAILLSEPDGDLYAQALDRADKAIITAPSAFEFLLVAHRKKGDDGVRQAQRILASDKIAIAAWDEKLLPAALSAVRRFGKGTHKAQLNFGDCLVYAFATAGGLPLLYKSDNFAQTDVVSALA